MKIETWNQVCSTDDLVENSGVCALINDRQIAIFYIPNTEKQVFAVDNYDPLGKANVIYRGLVGSLAEKIVVASPLYKQHFSLTSGECIEDESVNLAVYPTRIVGEQVQILA